MEIPHVLKCSTPQHSPSVMFAHLGFNTAHYTQAYRSQNIYFYLSYIFVSQSVFFFGLIFFPPRHAPSTPTNPFPVAVFPLCSWYVMVSPCFIYSLQALTIPPNRFPLLGIQCCYRGIESLDSLEKSLTFHLHTSTNATQKIESVLEVLAE